MPRVKQPQPVFTSSCGACAKPIPCAMALRQAGYCETCEFMTTNEASERLVIDRKALHRMAAKGELPKIKITAARVIYRRADVEHIREQRIRDGRGFIGLPHPQTV